MMGQVWPLRFMGALCQQTPPSPEGLPVIICTIHRNTRQRYRYTEIYIVVEVLRWIAFLETI